MQHGAHCGCGVYHIGQSIGLAGLHVPTHEDERDVCVGWVPRSVCRAVESGLHCPVEIVGLSYGVDVARTALIISVDDALTNPLRQR